MVFCKIIGNVEFAWLPINLKSALGLRLCSQWKRMSIAFVHLGWILWLITPTAVKLFAWIGVRGCGWPILASICCKYTASFAFKYRAPNAASATNAITALIIVAAVRVATLLGGIHCHWIRKMSPPLGSVISFCCSILHHCALQELFCLLCMQAQLHPALHNNLTVVLLLLLFSPLDLLAWWQLH